MRLDLKRTHLNEHTTTGELFVDGVFECYTLEDIVRKPGTKVYGETAIPEGVYQVIVNFSQRFQRYMPRLMNVPMFSGILIHSGNTDKNTEGCILVGDALTDAHTIKGGTSTAAYHRLFPKIVQALKMQQIVDISITNEFPEEIKG